MSHAPNPWHEVQDTYTTADHHHWWVFFEEAFGGVKIEMPVLIPQWVFGREIRLSKYMVLEVIAALLVLAIYIPLARRIRTGDLPKGRWWNFFEFLLLFVRDDIARPALSSHGHDEEADKFLPFLWTLFLFILFSNLLGLIPMMGSPTASIWVTAGLALCSFIMLHAAGIAKHGVGHYFAGLWPHIEVPYVGWFFSGFIFVLEFIGTFIKGVVLSIRLFANMLAGHLVLANIMLFIYVAGNALGLGAAWGGITVITILASVALSILELFVAFLQAYVFTFLTALFMGMNMNPEH
jgi:F-type H+-transporting ATPase subunit a